MTTSWGSRSRLIGKSRRTTFQSEQRWAEIQREEKEEEDVWGITPSLKGKNNEGRSTKEWGKLNYIYKLPMFLSPGMPFDGRKFLCSCLFSVGLPRPRGYSFLLSWAIRKKQILIRSAITGPDVYDGW